MDIFMNENGMYAYTLCNCNMWQSNRTDFVKSYSLFRWYLNFPCLSNDTRSNVIGSSHALNVSDAIPW